MGYFADVMVAIRTRLATEVKG